MFTTKQKRWLSWGVAGAVVVAVVVVLLLRIGRTSPTLEVSPTGAGGATGAAISVKTIQPKRDPNFVITTGGQPADVEAYNHVDLESRVAGPVGIITKDIGSHVTKGEPLLTIDVPDLQASFQQKEALVDQRTEELELSRVQVKSAVAAEDIAQSNIKLKQSMVRTAESEKTLREEQLSRFTQLAQGEHPAAMPELVDERKQAAAAAAASADSARADVDRARAELLDAKAKHEAALMDVNLKKAMLDVAKEDRKYAKVMVDFATIRAPWNGVVTHRYVDPGQFVQNASNGHGDTLLSLDRTDIVTISMMLPDIYAHYITPSSEAIIEMTELPGVLIRGKVTRFTPSLETKSHDRRMRVEVDLWNGSKEAYDKFLAGEKEYFREHKRYTDDLNDGQLPLYPTVTGDQRLVQENRLLPGMFGTMKLVLRTFQNAYLLPSRAVVTEGGENYLYEVKDGKAVRVPVKVQVDDGILAKVLVVEKVGHQTVTRELTGNEQVISSNQGELSDGQPVKASPVDWHPHG